MKEQKLMMFQNISGKLVSIRTTLLEVGESYIILKEHGKPLQLNCDYYVRDFFREGTVLLLLLYESGGKLYPMRVNPVFEFPLESPKYEPLAVHTGQEKLFRNSETVRLLEEQKNLTSDILKELKKRDKYRALTSLIKKNDFLPSVPAVPKPKDVPKSDPKTHPKKRKKGITI